MVWEKAVRTGVMRVSATAALLGMAAMDVSAQTSAACSAAFHAALEPTRAKAAPVLAGLMQTLRRPDADLTGRWLFANAVFAKPSARGRGERVCAETRRVNGRDVCRRFENRAQKRPADITTKAQPPAEDLRLMRAVNDLVELKGAVPEVGPNGRQVAIIARAANEVRNYLTQPEHPFLCSGVPDVMGFYAAQVAPMKKRHDDVQALVPQLRDAALARTREIVVAELATWERTIAASARRAGTTLADLTKAIAEGKTTDLPTVDPTALPPRPPEPATLDAFKLLSRTALMREALRPLLPATLAAAAIEPVEPIAVLTKARAALLDPDVRRDPVDPVVADTAIAALRLIEALVYAERYAARHAIAEQAFGGTFSAIRAAHAQHCTCRDTN